MRTSNALAAAGLLALLLPACGADPTAPEDLSLVRAPESGDGQVGRVGMKLLEPLRVLVLRDGGPAEGVSVRWSTPHGAIDQSSTTDADGIATAEWTMPSSSFEASAAAALPVLPGSQVTFSATAAFPSLSKVSGDNQAGPAGERLPEPLRVRATWDGAPLKGEIVKWSAETASSFTVTDDDGVASAEVEFSTTAGERTIYARIGVAEVGPQVSFVAKARPGPATTLEWIAAPAYWIEHPDWIGRSELRGLASDAFGNPVSNLPLHVALTAGSGVVLQASSSTDPEGMFYAVLDATPGSRDDLTVTISAMGIEPIRTTLVHADFLYYHDWGEALSGHAVTVPRGSTVRWVSIAEMHVLRPQDGSLPGQAVGGEGSTVVEHRYDVAGTYMWVCESHPDSDPMTVTVVP